MHSTSVSRVRQLMTVQGYRGPVLLALLVLLVAAVPRATGIVAVGGAVVAVCLVALGALGCVAALVAAAMPVAAATALWRRRGRLRRPGNSVLAGCAVLAAAALLAFSLPAADWAMAFVALAGGAATVVLWFGWLFSDAPAAAVRPAGNWRWAVSPLLLAATAVLLHFQVPQQARFALARPALSSFAERAEHVAAGDGRLPQPSHLGTYPVDDVTAVGVRGFRFTVPGSGLLERTGFAYLPDGPPEDEVSYTHRSGPWYTWSDHEDL
ncbi:hypothetical protein [Kitasatospora arboriphila]|uniref:Uncharacterized protein n=1 Tax=Kitasatospora arboriphila TaxID=258052 RepID=A0ABN1TCN6_9ACTN